MGEYARLHGWVSGIVQGVGFRYFTQRKADRFGLTGWVRNLPDDRVEFVAEGPKGVLQDFLKEINIGPSAGKVDKVEVIWDNYKGEFTEFRIGL
jgi:acylphosphatase